MRPASASMSGRRPRTTSRPARCSVGSGLRGRVVAVGHDGGTPFVVAVGWAWVEVAAGYGQVASGPAGQDAMAHEDPLVEVGDAAQEGGVDREPLERDEQHERRQHADGGPGSRRRRATSTRAPLALAVSIER